MTKPQPAHKQCAIKWRSDRNRLTSRQIRFCYLCEYEWTTVKGIQNAKRRRSKYMQKSHQIKYDA